MYKSNENALLIKNLFEAPLVNNPKQEIVYVDKVSIDYSIWRKRVKKLANVLTSLGVKQGSTVGILDYDSHRYLEAYYAVPMIGAVLHMLNMRLSAENLAYTIEHAEDDLIICHSDFVPLLEQIKGRISSNRKYILINESLKVIESSIDFEGEYEILIEAASSEFDFQDFDENTIATTFYTTGTTGLPKGVYYSHRQLVIHTLVATTALASPTTQGRFHRESVYMPLTPMFHVHAWGIPYVATYLGVKQVYPGKYIPSVILNLISKHKVTYSHCVPTILSMLIKDPTIDQYDLSNWTCIVGGAALTKKLVLEVMKLGVDIHAGYGMSETCPVVSTAHLTTAELEYSLEEQAELRVRTGKPVGLVQCRVVDNNGNDVPWDDKTPGEILLRGPYLTQGYLKDLSHSDKLWKEGWLHTGDVACFDQSGSLRITDRMKDLIKVGGEWISSLELEDVIAKNEHVAEVAVIGFPDARWSEVPMAIVVPKEDCIVNERDILEVIKESVKLGIIPRETITLKIKVADVIDKTSVGKVDKVALRKKYI